MEEEKKNLSIGTFFCKNLFTTRIWKKAKKTQMDRDRKNCQELQSLRESGQEDVVQKFKNYL